DERIEIGYGKALRLAFDQTVKDDATAIVEGKHYLIDVKPTRQLIDRRYRQRVLGEVVVHGPCRRGGIFENGLAGEVNFLQRAVRVALVQLLNVARALAGTDHQDSAAEQILIQHGADYGPAGESGAERNAGADQDDGHIAADAEKDRRV